MTCKTRFIYFLTIKKVIFHYFSALFCSWLGFVVVLLKNIFFKKICFFLTKKIKKNIKILSTNSNNNNSAKTKMKLRLRNDGGRNVNNNRRNMKKYLSILLVCVVFFTSCARDRLNVYLLKTIF